ncbi:hypothetical protein ON010_g9794 [Phytophthora cinnamomi]|nr:hypothetical protein ON010_g9794 [Phytophthora cinnamomi]
MSAGNYLVLIQEYRWIGGAEKQEIAAIVGLLREDNEHVVKWAVTALANLCWDSESYKALLCAENGVPRLLDSHGAIPRLVAMLRGDSSKEQEKAGVAAGSVRELVHMVRSGTSLQRLNAAGVLANIAVVTQFERIVANAGMIHSLRGR